ncbi:MAG: Wzz/FepE/Etk N-terminal domain-containing protein [Desulfarculaceae bacterium]|jgi:polysaccharide chain length determinant protein (PEP-CTERM system associated)
MQTASIDIRRYLFILRKHWKACTFLGLLVVALGIAYCFLWPKVYQATALVVVQPQKVPGDIVKATVTTRIDERLQIITQQVLSRTRLTELIERFDLYSGVKGSVAPDELAESMRKDITIKITRQNYFTIEYLYNDAQKVAAVTNALASFYVDSNLRLREQDALGTARFLTRELQRMRGELTEWDRKITEFKSKHLNELPENQDKNLVLLDQLKGEIEFIETRMAHLGDRIYTLQGEDARLLTKLRELELSVSAERRAGGTAGGGAATHDSHPSAIRNEIARLRVFYTDDHPDIQRLKAHLQRAEAAEAERQKRLKEKAKPGEEQPSSSELEMGSIQDARRRQAELLRTTKAKMKSWEEKRQATNKAIQAVQGWIANGPEVAEQLAELTRGYEVLKDAYQKMHAKWLDANMAANLERTQRGEQFEVVDPAKAPESPYRPNVRKAIPVTLGLALVLAVGLAFGLNYVDNSFNSVEQMERMSELPVLVVIPPLLTAKEISRRRTKTGFAVAVFTLFSVALLALVLILLTGKGQAFKNFVAGVFS